jgi:hypothetical protein
METKNQAAAQQENVQDIVEAILAVDFDIDYDTTVFHRNAQEELEQRVDAYHKEDEVGRALMFSVAASRISHLERKVATYIEEIMKG